MNSVRSAGGGAARRRPRGPARRRRTTTVGLERAAGGHPARPGRSRRPPSPARWRRRAIGLDLDVEERLDHGPPDQAARGPPDQPVGGAVGTDDPQAAVDRDHALGERFDQQVVIVAIGRQLVLEPAVLSSQRGHGADRIGVAARPGDGPTGAARRPRGRRAWRRQAEQDDDRDQPRLHGASIAQGPRARPSQARAAVGERWAGGSTSGSTRPGRHGAVSAAKVAGAKAWRSTSRWATGPPRARPGGRRPAAEAPIEMAAAASRAASNEETRQGLVVVRRRARRPWASPDSSRDPGASARAQRRRDRAAGAGPDERSTAARSGP